MFNGLNKLGLPMKYAIIGAVSVVVGVFLFQFLGIYSAGMSYLNALIAGVIGGAVGGWIRQKQGKHS